LEACTFQKKDTDEAVTFRQVTDPYNMEPSPEPADLPPLATSVTDLQSDRQPSDNPFHVSFDETPGLEAPGLEALSTAAASNFEYVRALVVPENSAPGANIAQSSSNDLNFILNPTGSDGILGKLCSSKRVSRLLTHICRFLITKSWAGAFTISKNLISIHCGS
jgi:hypothetical protein